MRTRIVLATAGILLMVFGLFRLVTEVPFPDLVILAVWLIGAVVIHDGILSPLVVSVGWAIGRVVPPRARRYVQFGFVAAGLVSVIALPLMYRQGTQPTVKALLVQNYGGGLTLLLGLIAAASLLAYAVHVARDQSRRPPTTKAPATKAPPEPVASEGESHGG